VSVPADDSLLARTASGAGWVVGFRLLTRLLGVASTLTLVRLLAPGDFGLVALAGSFAQTVDALSNLSVHEAIIRERAPDRAMYDTAFTMSLLRGLLTAGVVAAAAWPVAGFFHEPRLATVLLALALATLIGAAENIATADFIRTMAFRQEFKLWTLPRVLQVIGTIGFALIWPSYWALVFGIILARVVRTVMSYAMYPYLPRPTLVAWRRIVGFTSWTWAISIATMVRDRADTVLVGRFFSSTRVGIYALGNEIAALPTSELIDPLSRACFPSFSQLRHNGLSVGQTWLRLLAASALLVLPAGMGIALVADPLVKLAFGPRWLEAVPMIQILGISASITAIGSLTATLFSAYGMLRTTFAIVAAATVARIVLLATFLPGGTLVTAAILSALLSVLEQTIYLMIAMRRFAVSPGDLLRATWRSLLGTGTMAAGLIWLGLGFAPAAAAFLRHLLTSAAAGAAIYATVVTLAWVASGRPDGPERDLLTLVGSVARRLAALRAPRLVIW
jgi:O-antigen/teichoic acid export membrane protein